MIKTVLKYLFSLGFLLLLGSQQGYAYVSDSARHSETTRVPYTNDDNRAGTTEFLSNTFFADQRQRHALGEEVVEEEEERTESTGGALSDYVLHSFSYTLALRSLLLLPKKKISIQSTFLHFPSYKRYLRFEVFRI